MIGRIQEILGSEAQNLLSHQSNVSREHLHLPGSDFIDRTFVGSDRPTRAMVNRVIESGIFGTSGVLGAVGRKYAHKLPVPAEPTGQTDHIGATVEADITKQNKTLGDGGDNAFSFGKTHKNILSVGLFNAIQDVHLPKEIGTLQRSLQCVAAVVTRTRQALEQVCRMLTGAQLVPCYAGIASIATASGEQTVQAYRMSSTDLGPSIPTTSSAPSTALAREHEILVRVQHGERRHEFSYKHSEPAPTERPRRHCTKRRWFSSLKWPAALRLGAQSLYTSRSYLGDYFRRMRARLGPPAAITAAAHKIARILYHLITTRQRYDESVFAVLEQRAQQRQISILKKRASVLGFELKPAACVP